MFAIQIGTGTNNYLIDLETIPIKSVLPYLDRTLVMHNACFDVGFLIRAGFFPKSVRDTYLASLIYYNGLPMNHSFGDCMNRELEINYDKSTQKNIHKVKLSTAQAIQYCFNDVDKLLSLYDTLCMKLTEWGAMESYMLHCRHIVALAYIEQCGLPISTEKWKAKMASDIKERDDKAEIVRSYIFDNLPKFRNNQLSLFDTEKKLQVLLSSSNQMIPVFEEFGINVIVEDNGVEKKSIDKDVIAKSDHEFAKLWVDYKKIEHDITTYGKNILERIENERLYTSFHPIKDTARLSTRRGGINFLNFPSNKKTRECFYTGKNVLVGCDFTAQEAVVLADLSQDEMMLKSVTEGVDLHIEFARKIFPEIAELSNEEILDKHKDKRTAAKAPRFNLNYLS